LLHQMGSKVAGEMIVSLLKGLHIALESTQGRIGMTCDLIDSIEAVNGQTFGACIGITENGLCIDTKGEQTKNGHQDR